MFDLYVGSWVETVDKDGLTLTGEKLSLTLHAGLVAATRSPLCVFLIFRVFAWIKMSEEL